MSSTICAHIESRIYTHAHILIYNSFLLCIRSQSVYDCIRVPLPDMCTEKLFFANLVKHRPRDIRTRHFTNGEREREHRCAFVVVEHAVRLALKISWRTREPVKRLDAHGRLDCTFRRRKYILFRHLYYMRNVPVFIRRWFTGRLPSLSTIDRSLTSSIHNRCTVVIAIKFPLLNIILIYRNNGLER